MRPVRALRGRLVGVSALALMLVVVLLLLGMLPVPLYRHEPVAWEHPRSSDGGRVLEVTIIHGECDAGGAIRVRMRPDEVEVRTYTKEYALPQEPVWSYWTSAGCSAVGVFQVLRIRLPEPLGDRPAYDPAYGHRELPAEG